MKMTGITRPIDELGRIVLPKELRRTMNIQDRDMLEIGVEDDRIILRKYEPCCTFCGNAEEVTTFGGRFVCRECIDELKKL